jgi:hypothetical protein
VDGHGFTGCGNTPFERPFTTEEKPLSALLNANSQLRFFQKGVLQDVAVPTNQFVSTLSGLVV